MDEKRKIRALFFDVDGTLVSFRTHRVPGSARAALEEAHRRGVRIFIATGRAVGDLAVLKEFPKASAWLFPWGSNSTTGYSSTA